MNDLISDPEPTPELPDLYTPAAQLFLLLNLGNSALLSRPTDPLPRALAKLTEFDQAAVGRMQAVQDAASLYALVMEDAETFADHLVLGGLVYASPLGLPLAALLAPDGSADDDTVAERRAEVVTYVTVHAAWLGTFVEGALLTRYAEEDRAEVAQERAEFRAAAEAAFAEWQHTLGSKNLGTLVLTAPAAVLPVLGPGWSLQPMQVQLDMLALATTALGVLPGLSDHPFAQAVAHLPEFHPQRLEELTAYLNAAEAGQRLPLSREQGLLLYVAAHVVMLLFVSDVLDGEGLDDLLLQAPKDEHMTPAMVTKMREAAAIMLAAYIENVRTSEAEEEDFQALEARLTPVLALAVG